MVNKTSRISYLTRTLATALAMVFGVHSTVLIHAAESNIWTERLAARNIVQAQENERFEQLAKASSEPAQTQMAALPHIDPSLALPLTDTALSSLGISSDLRADERAALIKKWIPDWMQTAVMPHATIQDVELAEDPNAKTVLLFQDAHLHYEAQSNIAAAMDALGRALKKNKSTLLVGLEAASIDNFDFSDYERYPYRKEMREAAEALLRANAISGPEFAAIGYVGDGTGPVALPMKVTGIESQAEYDANVRALKASVPLKEKAKQALEALKKELVHLKKDHYDKKLHVFDSKLNGFQDHSLSVPEYVLYLDSVVPAARPQTRDMIEAALLEGSINFKKVEAERSVILRTLVEKMSDAGIKDLLQVSTLYRSGQMTYSGYYDYLKTVARKHGVDLSRFPEMNLYIQYVLKSEGIDVALLFDEIRDLEKGVQEVLFKTWERRSIADLTKDYHLLTKLMNHELTEEEWDDYQERQTQIEKLPARLAKLGQKVPSDINAMAEDWAVFEDFYHTALTRNATMAKKLTARLEQEETKTAVLVAGGFHTNGLIRELKQYGVHILTLSPKMTTVNDSLSSLDFLAEDRTPLNQLLVGEKLFLANARPTANPAEQRQLIFVVYAISGALVRGVSALGKTIIVGPIKFLLTRLGDQVWKGSNEQSVNLSTPDDGDGFAGRVTKTEFGTVAIDGRDHLFLISAVVFISQSASLNFSAGLGLWFFAILIHELFHLVAVQLNLRVRDFGTYRWRILDAFRGRRSFSERWDLLLKFDFPDSYFTNRQRGWIYLSGHLGTLVFAISVILVSAFKASSPVAGATWFLFLFLLLPILSKEFWKGLELINKKDEKEIVEIKKDPQPKKLNPADYATYRDGVLHSMIRLRGQVLSLDISLFAEGNDRDLAMDIVRKIEGLNVENFDQALSELKSTLAPLRFFEDRIDETSGLGSQLRALFVAVTELTKVLSNYESVAPQINYLAAKQRFKSEISSLEDWLVSIYKNQELLQEAAGNKKISQFIGRLDEQLSSILLSDLTISNEIKFDSNVFSIEEKLDKILKALNRLPNTTVDLSWNIQYSWYIISRLKNILDEIKRLRGLSPKEDPPPPPPPATGTVIQLELDPAIPGTAYYAHAIDLLRKMGGAYREAASRKAKKDITIKYPPLVAENREQFVQLVLGVAAAAAERPYFGKYLIREIYYTGNDLNAETKNKIGAFLLNILGDASLQNGTEFKPTIKYQEVLKQASDVAGEIGQMMLASYFLIRRTKDMREAIEKARAVKKYESFLNGALQLETDLRADGSGQPQPFTVQDVLDITTSLQFLGSARRDQIIDIEQAGVELEGQSPTSVNDRDQTRAIFRSLSGKDRLFGRKNLPLPSDVSKRSLISSAIDRLYNDYLINFEFGDRLPADENGVEHPIALNNPSSDLSQYIMEAFPQSEWARRIKAREDLASEIADDKLSSVSMPSQVFPLRYNLSDVKEPPRVSNENIVMYDLGALIIFGGLFLLNTPLTVLIFAVSAGTLVYVALNWNRISPLVRNFLPAWPGTFEITESPTIQFEAELAAADTEQTVNRDALLERLGIFDPGFRRLEQRYAQPRVFNYAGFNESSLSVLFEKSIRAASTEAEAESIAQAAGALAVAAVDPDMEVVALNQLATLQEASDGEGATVAVFDISGAKNIQNLIRAYEANRQGTFYILGSRAEFLAEFARITSEDQELAKYAGLNEAIAERAVFADVDGFDLSNTDISLALANLLEQASTVRPAKVLLFTVRELEVQLNTDMISWVEDQLPVIQKVGVTGIAVKIGTEFQYLAIVGSQA